MSGMKRRFSEVQVGVLTMAAILVLVVGILWFKNIDLSQGTAIYLADFPQVEGLQPGDRVQVRGIRMGEVGDFEMLPDAVRVELLLDASVKLCEDAVVTLGEKGIVGEVVIEISPGQGVPVEEGHVFQGRTAGTIASMTDAADDALAEMRQLTGKVTELIDEIKTQGKVVETLAQANETLVKVDDMVEQNHGEVQVILNNLVAATEDLKGLLASGTIDSTLNRTSLTMASADSMLISLNRSAVRLERILTNLEEGRGSAGMLLNDPALYARTDSTLTSLKRLMDEMRRNPKKYFKLNVMDF
ncbi:MCE family protein [bacterium]|nr:MCE family protein [bacterium]